MSAPPSTPSREFATASSQSLCVWMPIRAELRASRSAFTMASTPRRISSGIEPPFVSQRTTQDAPAGRGQADLDRILRVARVAVEEVLRIEYQLVAHVDAIGDGLLDHGEVLTRRRFKDCRYLPRIALADEG